MEQPDPVERSGIQDRNHSGGVPSRNHHHPGDPSRNHRHPGDPSRNHHHPGDPGDPARGRVRRE